MGTLYTLYNTEKRKNFELGKGSWFPICKSDDIMAFRFPDLWTRDALAEFVFRACSTRGADRVNRLGADVIAQHILEWAGNDLILMCPDTFSAKEEAAKMGLNIGGRRATVTRWARLTEDHRPSESDHEELDEIASEIRTKEMLSMEQFVQAFAALR